MVIRKAEISDIGAVADLVRGLSTFYLEEGGSTLPTWFKATLSDAAFVGRFVDSEFHNYVAEHNGSIVGYISIKDGFHLYHLFVSSKYHKQGIAKSLWRHCVKVLTIDQCTVRSSLYAVPVYSKFGFSLTEDIEYKDGIAFQAMVYKGVAG